MTMNKWHIILSGILHLLLWHTQVLGFESCGKYIASSFSDDWTKSGNIEDFMEQLDYLEDNNSSPRKSCESFFRWIDYLMHQKNIDEVKNISQLKEDIFMFPIYSTPNEEQTRDELIKILNVDFLQGKQDDAPRTARCQFRSSFTVNEISYHFPGGGHIFLIEKAGKDEFRLWQSWIFHYSGLEWFRGKLESETEPRDPTYTRGNQPLNRQEAERLVHDLIMYSDSNLDWNRREQLGAKLFWTNPNVFFSDSGDLHYFDSNGDVSQIASCEQKYEEDGFSLIDNVRNYLSNPENKKAVEERRKSSKECVDNLNLKEWFLRCDKNIYSRNQDVIYENYIKCYSSFTKKIDISKLTNLPKVEIKMLCNVTSNPNNGEQCAQNSRYIHKLITENS